MRNTPSDSICVTTYGELDRYLQAFAEGQLGLLILLGRHGIGKTQRVRAALNLDGERDASTSRTPSRALYIAGRTSPFTLYQRLWDKRDLPVVIDDLDRLYAEPDSIRLLKQLCNSNSVKQLSWLSQATGETHALPQYFETSSTVVLIGNTWRTLNADVRALEDRAIVISFEPSNSEVHDSTGQWFDDPIVHTFIGTIVADVPQLSIRHYLKGRALRQAGFGDWQATVLKMLLVDAALATVVRLQHDQSFDSEEERVARFVQECGRSRATYFRLKRQLPSTARSCYRGDAG